MSTDEPRPSVPVNFLCPAKLLDDFDSYVKNSEHFTTRTELLRCLMRNVHTFVRYLQAKADAEDAPSEVNL